MKFNSITNFGATDKVSRTLYAVETLWAAQSLCHITKQEIVGEI